MYYAHFLDQFLRFGNKFLGDFEPNEEEAIGFFLSVYTNILNKKNWSTFSNIMDLYGSEIGSRLSFWDVIFLEFFRVIFVKNAKKN